MRRRLLSHEISGEYLFSLMPDPFDKCTVFACFSKASISRDVTSTHFIPVTVFAPAKKRHHRYTPGLFPSFNLGVVINHRATFASSSRGDCLTKDSLTFLISGKETRRSAALHFEESARARISPLSRRKKE